MIKSILLVEDDRDIRENMSMFLESEGYKVVTAPHGQQALELLKSQSELPELVLLDLMMPVMDGMAFMREWKKSPEWAHIPVLLMTAHGNAEAVLRDSGAAGLIRKPIDIEEVSVILKNQAW